MGSFAFQVVVECPLAIVFAFYADTERWRNRNLFGDIRWVQGKPWEEGSRLRIETLVPIRSVIDQVVLQFVPQQRVVYISHVFGVTCETSVGFVSSSDRQTVISISMELVGTTSRILGFALEPAIAKATKSFFDELRRECEAAAQAAGET